MPLNEEQMRYTRARDQMLPVVAGYVNPGPTRNLRGVEANTNESKGVPYSCPPASGPMQEYGEPGGVLEESY
jgi:hypothetical protein